MRRLLASIFFFLVLASLQAAPEPKWEKLEGCTFVKSNWADGDSFHVKHNGKDMIVRLYFVDTPEDAADTRFPERIAEQAAYFGLSSEAVLKIGDKAAEFTARTLGAEPFTVYTCGQDAMGASAQQRIYGLVQTKQGWLAELLVKNGLARVYGKKITLPDGTDSKTYVAKLTNIEDQAKAQKLGGWAK